MSQENSQFEIQGIQLRESKTQPRVSLSREIGEAQITHTIFGKAKVRIIRKNDKLYRTLWLTAGIGVAAILAAVWQGWYTAPQTEPQQGIDLTLSVNSEVQAGVPPTQLGNITPSGVLPTAKSEPVAPQASGVNPPVAVQKNAPQQPTGMQGSVQITEKPAAVQPKPAMIKPKPVYAEPITASKPPAAPIAPNQNAMKDQTVSPQPARKLPVRRPIPAAVATSPVAQPAASSPATAAPMAVPQVKEEAASQSPMDDTQLSAPINAPAK